MQSEKRGHQRFDRLGWAEIREWAFLQLVRRFAPIPSGLGRTKRPDSLCQWSRFDERNAHL